MRIVPRLSGLSLFTRASIGPFFMDYSLKQKRPLNTNLRRGVVGLRSPLRYQQHLVSFGLGACNSTNSRGATGTTGSSVDVRRGGTRPLVVEGALFLPPSAQRAPGVLVALSGLIVPTRTHHSMMNVSERRNSSHLRSVSLTTPDGTVQKAHAPGRK